MGGILSQLAQLFIQTIPTVIFVFVVYVILSRFLFAPLTAVLKKREEATTGAMARAAEQAAAEEEKARQYENAFQAARQEVYRQREVDRRAILKDREATLKRAQQHSEALRGEAQASLAAEVARSKEELRTTCPSLGQEIAETILGGAANGGGGGVQP
jgi:F-type H+-transporting ATPase subunit b